MIKLLFPVPRQVCVAFSGGVDSVAVVDFLRKNHAVTCAFYHHGTENSERAFEFVSNFCSDNDLPLIVGYLHNPIPKGRSKEDFWRECRYNFLSDIHMPIVTAHHLDDCVETWLWSSMHGKPKVIPNSRGNIIRPFLTTPKKEFVNWCNRKELKWCEDLSNEDINFTRNYIRHMIMPHALKVNPGMASTVKKIVLKQNEFDKDQIL